MLKLYPNLEAAEVDSGNSSDNISVSAALKLATSFKGGKWSTN